MQKFILLVITLFCLSTYHAEAAKKAARRAPSGHSGELGLGFILGEPTGLTAKYFVDTKHAIDFGLAYSFGSFVLIYIDYLWHYYDPFRSSRKKSDKFLRQLSLYVGAGGALLIAGSSTSNRAFTNNGRNSVGVGFRIPLGIEWRPGDPSIGIHLELAPGIGLVPGLYGFLMGGIGIRYYF